MGKKKKKKKFKKKYLRAQQNQMGQSQKSQPVNNQGTEESIKVKPPASSEVDTVEVDAVKEDQSEDKEYQYIKKDTKKVLIIFAVILIIIVAAYIVNINTVWFKDLSDWLFEITNIQIQ